MAKGRKKNGQFAKGGGGTRVRAPAAKATNITVRAAAPIANTNSRRTKKRRASPRRSSGGIGNILGGRVGGRTAIVLGSAALGYASKEKWLEKLPVIGKAGPITSFGLLGWGAEELLHMKLPPLLHDMITSALALSAFNIGFSSGQTLVGDDAHHMPGGAVFFD